MTKKTAGIVLIIVSCILWGMIIALPFLDLRAGEVAAATTVLVVAGEAAFWLGILLAGRDIWERIKLFFKTMFS